jgi:hypothetical protein
MATPQETIEAALLAALQAIKTSTGWRTTVQTVEFTHDEGIDLSRVQTPAVLISVGSDSPARETFGGQVGNAFERLWAWTLTLIPGDSVNPRKAGYDLRNDVEKALLTNREGTDLGKRLPLDLSIDLVEPYKFEMVENSIAQFRMTVLIKYLVTTADM